MTVVFCFFCKQKTAYEMRISDWSSDVVLFRSAWFGAANVTPSRRLLYPVGRFLMVLSRSVHEIVWALIFVSAVGLGALPGILAVAIRSVGFISKRSEERRVGKECGSPCRSRGSPYRSTQKTNEYIYHRKI